jgi:hypothetical protein
MKKEGFIKEGRDNMSKEEKVLKEKLIRIKESNYLLEEQENYFSLVKEMMSKIGSIDPVLRDELIYTTLYHWIIEDKLTSDQLKCILQISLDSSHLFYKLEAKEEDAVFTRAFSVLIIALIIYKHREDNFLSDETLYEIKGKLVEYMLVERDVRGFVEEKGWAHSAAHTADALDELVQCALFNKMDLQDILNSIKAKVCIGYYVYIHEESERMVNAVENAFNRNILANSEIVEWLQGFKIKAPKDKSIKSIENYHLKVNIKGFLRSLYFRLLDREECDFIILEIRKLLENL